MEEVKDYKDAWEGDLVEYRNRIYRVIGVDFEAGGNIKFLKIVKNNPIAPFVRVLTIRV